MFLHLVDNEKFTASSVSLFRMCDPGNHTFVRIVDSHVDISDCRDTVTEIIEIEFSSGQFYELMQNLKDYTAVFIHNLFNCYHIYITNNAHPGATLVWFFWGGELWTIPRLRTKIMMSLTKGLFYKNQIIPWLQRNWKKYVALLGPEKSQYTYFKKKQKRLSLLCVDLEQAIQRVDYIVPVFEDDFFLLQRTISCKAQRLEWNYPCPSPLTVFNDIHISGNNWLAGNSSHYSNNHFELFRYLKKIKGHRGKVIVPLSYGDEDYRRDVVWLGRKLLKDRFRPLTGFLPYEKYLETLASCSAAFFNTRRQQAMGNIFSLMYLGTRVFLREDGPVYHFLKRRQAVIFSIPKDIPSCARAIETPLDKGQLNQNRKVVDQIASEEAIKNKTQKMLSLLCERKQQTRT